MQSRIALLLLLATGAAATESAALLTARAWLRGHSQGPPTNDELGELKGVNPEAYALVKALLTKRSLGLLDPKHPTASFAAAAPQAHVDQQEAGSNPFSQFAQPGEVEAHSKRAEAPVDDAVTYPDAPAAPAAKSHDWLNWKPASAAMDDDAMVKNVLGAVAGLMPGGARPAAAAAVEASSASPLAADADILGSPSQVAVAPMSAEASEQPKAVAPVDKQENSYFKFSDPFGAQAQAAQARATRPGHNFLGSDAAITPTAAAMTPVDSAPKAQPQNSLMAWLGKVQPGKAAPAAPVVQAPAARSYNSYLSDLN